MGKMSELDQLFRDIGDDIFREMHIRFHNPNHTDHFYENHKGYTYFWDRKSMEDVVFDDDDKKIIEMTEIFTQFALLVDFSHSNFKCICKNWDVFYKDEKYSDPTNEIEEDIQANDFNSFIDMLIDFLMDDHGYEGYSLINDMSIISRLKKLQQDICEE